MDAPRARRGPRLPGDGTAGHAKRSYGPGTAVCREGADADREISLDRCEPSADGAAVFRVGAQRHVPPGYWEQVTGDCRDRDRGAHLSQCPQGYALVVSTKSTAPRSDRVVCHGNECDERWGKPV